MSPPTTGSTAPPAAGHAPHVDVAMILDREEDRVAVPDRLANGRVRAALEVELLRQHSPLARRGVEDSDPVVTRPVEAARAPVARDRRAVRRPRGQVVEVVVLREPLRLASRRVDDPDLPGAAGRPSRRHVRSRTRSSPSRATTSARRPRSRRPSTASAGDEPSAGTTKTCVRRSPVQPTESSL